MWCMVLYSTKREISCDFNDKSQFSETETMLNDSVFYMANPSSGKENVFVLCMQPTSSNRQLWTRT